MQNLYQKRLSFLGKTIDGSLALLGLALILTGLARLFKVYDSPLSAPQFLQGLLGLSFLIFGIFRRTTYCLNRFKDKSNKINSIVGLFPFISFTLFFIYRIQLKDLQAYGRLVEEGSLVEWFSFLFLLLSSIIFLLVGKQSINRFANKTSLGIGVLTFILSMEEVSWGQMIFNWKSPEFFNQLNAQQETNLHNLIFISGKPNTLIVCLVLILLTYFCCLNYYLNSKNKLKPNSILDLILPPISLIGYFLIGGLIYLGLTLQMQGINIPILMPRDQEIIECFFALGVLFHSCRIYLKWGYNLSHKDLEDIENSIK